MSQPAERRDLYAIDPTDPFADHNRFAQAHNDARYERSLIKQGEQLAELRTSARRNAYRRAMDLLEAQEAWRIATGEIDPYTGRLDDAGYPTMTEAEWIAIHGWHPPMAPTPSPVPPPPSFVEEDMDGDGVDEAATEPAANPEPIVPPRKRGEPIETWARRVLEANPTIGWKRLSTLVGGKGVLTEGPARRIVDAHRAGGVS